MDNVTTVRLHKYLAEAGVASRRHAEAMMAEGRVAVNGTVVTAPGFKIDPAFDIVTADGAFVAPPSAYVYYMLHKPEGVVTTADDPQGRETVMAYLPPSPRVFPVGRLDYETSGLLLLTNDGALAQRLTHPSYETDKTYLAWLRGVPDKDALSRFRSGLMLDGKKTAACHAEIRRTRSSAGGESCQLRVVLREGRNRQVRRMCALIGHPVLTLERVAVGGVKLGQLPKGRYRLLTDEEIHSLKHKTNIATHRMKTKADG